MAKTPTTTVGLALLSVEIAVIILSWITVITRIWVRNRINALGVDDSLMAAGLVIYTISAVFSFLSILNGIGTLDKDLDPHEIRIGLKWFWAGAITYPPAAFAIKSSICTALLRFARSRRYRIPLYAIMVLSAIAALAAVLTWALQCEPIAANWDPTLGKCAGADILVGISYYQSANSIATDWACAILPGFLLWDLQLKLRVKVSIILLLAMGVVASTATIIRLAYIMAYVNAENYMYNVANIALWSNVEIGFGVIAGSAATFRPLFRLVPFFSQTSYSGRSGGPMGQSQQLNTITTPDATRPDKSRQDPYNIDAWDADSQKHILKETNFEISVEQRVLPV